MAGDREFRTDQGWSWVILVAGFFSCLIFDGVIFSFGIFLSDLAQHFEEGLGTTAWIGSTIGAMYALIGPLASILANKFGCRIVTIAGSIIASGGFVLSTFSTAVWFMALTYGVMGGIGFGLMYQCAYVMVGHYFDKRRALATGITACGSGVGIFIFGQIGDLMLSHYGWKGSMWIIAGIALNGAVLGALYRPIPTRTATGDGEGETKAKLFTLSVFKSPAFMIFGCSSFLCLIGFMVPFMYLPSFAIATGATQKKSSMLISVIGITNTIGRVACGWISDKSWADPLKIYNASMIIGGSLTVACAWLTNYPLQVTYAALFGLSIACYVSLCAIILIEILDLERLSNAFGLLNMFRGLATIIGSPLAGILYDYTGRFDLAFYVAGSSIATAGVICLPLRLLSQCRPGNANNQSNNEKCMQSLEDLKSMEKASKDDHKYSHIDDEEASPSTKIISELDVNGLKKDPLV